MLAEQLPLSHLRVRSKGPVGIALIINDVATDPTIIMARRPSGLWMPPGGKLEHRRGEYKRPSRGTRREVMEETGIAIWSDEFLVELHNSPFRIAADGVERTLHAFLAFGDECAPTTRPRRMEPLKNGPWKRIPIRTLPFMKASGILHPVMMQIDFDYLIGAAQESDDATKSLAEQLFHIPIRETEGFLAYIHERDAMRIYNQELVSQMVNT